jgi:hypothetical protein
MGLFKSESTGKHATSGLTAKEQKSIRKDHQNQEKELKKQRAAEWQDILAARRDEFIADNTIGKIAIDNEHRLFRVEMGLKSLRLVASFDELKGYELFEDDASVTSGGLGGAAVGAVALGAVGAVAGSLVGKKKQRPTVSRLTLRLDFDSTYMPCYMVNFLTSETKKASFTYRTFYDLAQQSISALEMILKETGPTTTAIVTATEETSTGDPVDKVKQLKELLDMGVITQDEFTAKSRQLLGL